MLNVPSKLRALDEPIRVGVIGAGLFGTNLIGSIERAPGMTTAAIADVETEKAVGAYDAVDVPRDEIVRTADADALDEALEAGERGVLGDGAVLAGADPGVDVVVEATGVPSVGARHAYQALTAGTHVVMVTVEADTVVGPALSRIAERNGAVYSMAYGDQPALLAELVDWAETVGLDVVAAGKGNPATDDYRHATPDDIFDRLGFDPAFVEERDLNPRMYNSFYDGTKVAVEMCAVANATGLEPDVPGMHLPTAEIPELPELFRPEAAGGILNGTGVVDTVRTRYPDGSAPTHDISMGVFVVTTTPDDRARRYLAENSGAGLHVASDGAYQAFYRPHHLPGIETTVSVASAALRGEPTGTPRHHVGEVVAAAKRDLEPGDELDGGGGATMYGVLESAGAAADADHVPFELLEGATVARPVARDEIVTANDVDLEASFLSHLRAIQDETVGRGFET